MKAGTVIDELESLALSAREEADQSELAPLLVRTELNQGRADRRLTWLREGVSQYAVETVPAMDEQDDEDVVGHYHPGTYAPRFDLQERDIAHKEAVHQARNEARAGQHDPHDRESPLQRFNLRRRFRMAMHAAAAALLSL